MIANELSSFQKESIELFVNAATAFSIPKSIGALYGLLFSTERPLTLDDLTVTLRMSRGSAHEGLRWLRGMGAVRVVSVPGQRKEHFMAETSLRRLAAGYLRDKIEPHLETGRDRLKILHESSSEDPSKQEFQKSRVNQIANWYKFLNRTLPALKVMAGRF